MAVRFDAASDRVAYTGGGVPDPTGGITLCGWAYVSVDQDDFATLARLYDGGTTVTFSTSSDGLGGPNYFTAGGSVNSSTGFLVGEWRKVAVSCTGTTGKVYIATPGGSTEVDSGTVGGAATPTSVALGGRAVGEAIEWWNGRLAYWRLWSAELSQAEIEAEWTSPTPVRTANLWADWPLETHTDLTDHSGNGRHLTAGSTATTTESGPPLTTAITGSGSLSAPAGVAAGQGAALVSAAGGVAAQPAAAAGVGSALITGSGGATAPPAGSAGVGASFATGTGGLLAAPAVAAGVGQVLITGGGGLLAPPAAVSGSDQAAPTTPASRTAVTPAEHRVAGGDMPDIFVKDPDATLDYARDWAADGWLAEGETIATSTWIVPDGLVEGATSNTDTVATVWVSGGTAGLDYQLTNRISTDQGRIDDRTITLMVRNR